MTKPKIICAAVAGMLILAEIMARFVGLGSLVLYQASPAGYEPRPNQDIVRINKHSHYNNFGMRGANIKDAPEKDIPRILTLGDSVNNGGTQVNDVDTWPAQLQSLFSQGRRSVEVLNASAGGWSVQNEYRWLVSHGTFGSKIVVLEVNEKDLGKV